MTGSRLLLSGGGKVKKGLLGFSFFLDIFHPKDEIYRKKRERAELASPFGSKKKEERGAPEVIQAKPPEGLRRVIYVYFA